MRSTGARIVTADRAVFAALCRFGPFLLPIEPISLTFVELDLEWIGASSKLSVLKVANVLDCISEVFEPDCRHPMWKDYSAPTKEIQIVSQKNF
jgi:hypothetical protein